MTTVCVFLAKSQPILCRASSLSTRTHPSTVKHTEPLKTFSATHIHFFVKHSRASKWLIPTLFLSPRCASLCKSYGHTASVLFIPESRWPLQHLNRSTIQIYNCCLVTHSDSKLPFCSLLYTGLTLCTFHTVFTLGPLTSRMFVSRLLLLPLPGSSFFRLIFPLDAVFGTAGFTSEIPNLLSRLTVRFR